jgi:hypothetical protein
MAALVTFPLGALPPVLPIVEPEPVFLGVLFLLAVPDLPVLVVCVPVAGRLVEGFDVGARGVLALGAGAFGAGGAFF